MGSRTTRLTLSSRAIRATRRSAPSASRQSSTSGVWGYRRRSSRRISRTLVSNSDRSSLRRSRWPTTLKTSGSGSGWIFAGGIKDSPVRCKKLSSEHRLHTYGEWVAALPHERSGAIIRLTTHHSHNNLPDRGISGQEFPAVTSSGVPPPDEIFVCTLQLPYNERIACFPSRSQLSTRGKRLFLRCFEP